MQPAEADLAVGTAVLFNENLPHLVGSLQESLQQHLLLKEGRNVQPRCDLRILYIGFCV